MSLTGRLGLLTLAAIAAGCGKKAEATPVADAAPKEAPTSCLHAQHARAYTWRQDPFELALDVELDWTCSVLAEDKLELTDTDIGAKLGEQKVKERYRVDEDGGLGEWEDPFLVGPPRLHGVFIYSVTKQPTAVGLRYGGVQILPTVPVTQDPPRTAPKPSMRIVATALAPAKVAGKTRVTALIELHDVPRTAGRSWKVPYVERTFYFDMKGEFHDGTFDDASRPADRVLDVDEKLVPIETPVASLPVRPAKRFVLAEVSASRAKVFDGVSLRTSESRVKANAEGAAKLVVPNDTRARLDAAPPSMNLETTTR